MNSKVYDAECSDDDVDQSHVLETLPTPIVIMLPEGKPYRKWYCNVKRRHAV